MTFLKKRDKDFDMQRKILFEFISKSHQSRCEYPTLLKNWAQGIEKSLKAMFWRKNQEAIFYLQGKRSHLAGESDRNMLLILVVRNLETSGFSFAIFRIISRTSMSRGSYISKSWAASRRTGAEKGFFLWAKMSLACSLT